jgi:UDP-N-acetylmuramate dehydrogenase
VVAVHAFGTFLRERGIPARFNEPLAPYTTFKIGGPADALVEPRDEDDLAAVFREARGAGLPVHVLGGGANLLVRDEGVRGAVVRLSGFNRRSGDRVGAGCGLPRIVKETVNEGLAGLEGLAGVPGTVGGAVRMNAGGRHGEIGSAVRSVDVMTPEGTFRRVPRAEAGFRYRGNGLGGNVVVAAEFDLRPDPAARERYDAVLARKKEVQPLNRPSAGCTFKNPPGGHAGQIIDGCGLKGTRVGGARVSDRHANFIVNEGGATASDVFRLIEIIRNRAPVPLELEVEVW